MMTKTICLVKRKTVNRSESSTVKFLYKDNSKLRPVCN